MQTRLRHQRLIELVLFIHILVIPRIDRQLGRDLSSLDLLPHTQILLIVLMTDIFLTIRRPSLDLQLDLSLSRLGVLQILHIDLAPPRGKLCKAVLVLHLHDQLEHDPSVVLVEEGLVTGREDDAVGVSLAGGAELPLVFLLLVPLGVDVDGVTEEGFSLLVVEGDSDLTGDDLLPVELLFWGEGDTCGD